MPSYHAFGHGPEKVLVMHNWFSDCTSYAPLLPYLDPDRYTFLLMDLRGYGNAKELSGSYSLQESIQDATNLVDALKWEKFHLVGHSMSSLIAQKLAVEHKERIKSLIAINPIPASGSPKSEELMTFLEEAALSHTKNALECIHVLTNRRYSDFAAQKFVDKWHACSTSQARMAYLHMFCKTDFSSSVKGLKTPMLVVFGDHDFIENEGELHKTFLKWYPHVEVSRCPGAGHFPMQETPMYLASLMEGFLGKYAR